VAEPPRVYSPINSGQLRQCEVVSGLVEPRARPEGLDSNDGLITDLKAHPLAIIMTQDCELEGDHRARNADPVDLKKQIGTVVLCEVYPEEEVRAAAREIGLNTREWKRVRQNREERFHYLQPVSKEEDAVGEGLTALGVDFKHIFALSPELLYYQIDQSARRRFKLESPYLEHLVVRFFAYQSRIALPVPHAFNGGE
jgi:hypothetical protein